ncbi:Ssu72-like family protein [Hibiscus syriacus]|uniref:Ssu72-like family protein n=2 Tax=Hibiscus syriacus TaxID=106335 RepID=A0A6A3BBK0_HIBSY|nr:Ssu72-like family protein [Hibiscus syriacus]
MGNAVSCAPLITSSGGAVKVVFPDGSLQIYTKPAKAADVMVENPGQFVCDSSSLKVGSRVHGLTADDELERRQVYFLLPMDLLYSVLTQEEMSWLSCNANKALKHASFNIGRIFPVVFTHFCIFPFDAKTPPPKNSVGNGAKDSVERFSKQRSWKPALDTILETPSS